MSFVSKPAPDFTADAAFKKSFTEVTLSSYKGRWVVLFFYPLDFTFVCPTEITAMSDLFAEFQKRDADVIGVSTDSKFSHNTWMQMPREQGGIGELAYPLVSDFSKEISESYGVLLPEGMALRSTFIIDPDGIVQFEMNHSLDVGRNVLEIIRNLDALQFARKTNEVCPAGWMPGNDTIVPDIEKSKEFFKNIKP